MLRIRLTDRLRETCPELNGESVTWTQLRESLQSAGKLTDEDVRHLLKDSLVTADWPLRQDEAAARRPLTTREYERLLGMREESPHLDMSEMRGEWRAVRRELAWLFNLIVTALAVATFVFCITMQWRLEARLMTAIVATMLLILVEVIIFAQRANSA